MKVCKVCKIEKCESDFHKRKNGKLRNECIDCKKAYLVLYRKGVQNNPFTQNSKSISEKTCNNCGETKNIEEFVKQKRICKVCKSTYLKNYYSRNKDLILKNSKIKYSENAHKIKIKNSEYSKNNRDKINNRSKRYKKDIIKNQPLYSIISSISSKIRRVINSNNFIKDFKTLDVIGCTKEELKIHIENQFQGGMSWSNRSEWHIDHIIPISLAETKDEVIFLSHYLNLRPMWAKDNIIKSNIVEDKNNPIYLRLLEMKKS